MSTRPSGIAPRPPRRHRPERERLRILQRRAEWLQQTGNDRIGGSKDWALAELGALEWALRIIAEARPDLFP